MGTVGGGVESACWWGYPTNEQAAQRTVGTVGGACWWGYPRAIVGAIRGITLGMKGA